MIVMAQRRMLLNSAESFIGTMRIEYLFEGGKLNLGLNNNTKIIEEYFDGVENGYYVIGFKKDLIVPEDFIPDNSYSEIKFYSYYNITFDTRSVYTTHIQFYGDFIFNEQSIVAYDILLYDYNYVFNDNCFTTYDGWIYFIGKTIPQYYKNINNYSIYAYSHILYDLIKYNNIEEGDERAQNYHIFNNNILTISSPTGYVTTQPNVDLGGNSYIYAVNRCMYNGNYITEYICTNNITYLRKGITLPQDATIYFPDTVTNIDSNTFEYGYNLKKVVIFGNCKLTYLYGFRSSSIENIKIYSDKITNIKNYCFNNTNIKSLYIPKNVSSIGIEISTHCKNVENIIVDENNLKYDSRNNCNAIILNNKLIQGCKNTIIPNNIDTIGSFAFSGMGLKEIIIPNSITILSQHVFSNNPIDNIIIPESVINIGPYCFNNTNIYNDTNNWINGILYISNCIISAKKDISGEITILDGTKLISEQSFYDLSNITKINIPNSLKYINDMSFKNMGDLTIEYDGTEEEWNNIVKDDGWNTNTNITYIFKEALLNEIYYTSTDGNIINVDMQYTNNELLSNTYEDKGKLVFKNTIDNITNLFKDSAQLKEVWLPDYNIPNTVSAFDNCANLISVNNSKQLLIGDYIFRSCTNLDRIEIDSSLIGDRAFIACTSLNYVKISKKVGTIKEFAFTYCTNLESIDYEGTIEEWNNIDIASDWRDDSAITTIHCSDGDIQL